VLIAHEVHEAFHKAHGYGNNTEAQFLEFCKNLHSIEYRFEIKEKVWIYSTFKRINFEF